MSSRSCIVWFIALCLAACQGSHQTKEELVGRGAGLLRAGNPGGAVVLLKQALDRDQSNFEARLYLAKAYLIAGKTDAAEKELRKLKLQRPDSQEGHIETARMYVQKNLPAEALKELAGIDSTNRIADVCEIRGVAYALQDEIEQAIVSLRQALEAAPDRTSVQVSLARVYATAGRYQEAREQLAAVMKREPANKTARAVLTAVQAQEGDITGALATCDEALRTDPDDLSVWYRKGLLYQKQGRYPEALAAAGEIVARAPNSPDGHLLSGILLFQLKKMSDAVVSLQKALSLRNSVTAHYYLALALFERNETEQAAAQVRQTLDLDPAYGQARALLALISLKRNKLDEAVNEARKAAVQDPRNAFVQNVLGSVCMAKGLFDEGLAALNRASELDPGLVDAHIKKGLFFISTKKYGEGEAELTTALRIKPEVLNSRLVLVAYYQRQGNHDRALRLLSEGLKGGAPDAVLYNMMAESYLRRNMIAEALDCWRKAVIANPADEHAALRLAFAYAAQGERDRAIADLEALVKRTSVHTPVFTALAALCEARGDEETAAAWYRRSREAGAAEAYLEEARYRIRKNDADRALRLLDEAIRKYPSNPLLHELKGRIHAEHRQYGDAIRSFEELEKLNRKLGLPFLINAYLDAGKSQKALDKIAGEIKKDPARLELRAEQARIFSVLGKKQEAVAAAREMIRTAPDEAAGYLALASVYQRSSEPQNAVDVLKRAHARDASLHLMLGMLYSRAGDYPAALAQFSAADAMKTGYAPAVFQKGLALHAMGKTDLAATEYRRVLELKPDDVGALNNLAYLYAENDRDTRQAARYAVRAYIFAPADGAVNDTLGYVLLRKGKIEEGLKVLKKAAALLPDDASVRYHLGLAYRERGDTALAIECLQKSLALGEFPQQKEARRLLERLQQEKRS